MLEILTLSSFWHMPYGGIHFCVNGMLTSCISVHLSEECIWNIFHMKFSSQFSQQIPIANAWNFNALFRLAYGRNHFCVNGMLTSCISVRLSKECIWNIVYMKFSWQFSSNYSLQMLEILKHSFFWHTIWWVSFSFTNLMWTSCLSVNL